MVNFMQNIKNFESEDFSTWFNKFKRCRIASGVKDDYALEMIPVFLEGSALNYFETLPEECEKSYSILVSYFKRRFNIPAMTAAQELERCTIGMSESFGAFAQRIKYLVDCAYLTFAVSYREVLYLEKFTRRIGEDFRDKIFLDQTITDIEKAVILCERLKSLDNFKVESSICSIKNTNNPDPDITELNVKKELSQH